MTVLKESPAGIISQKFPWLQFYLLFQCRAPGVKRNLSLFECEKVISCFSQVLFCFSLQHAKQACAHLCAHRSPLAWFPAWGSLAGFLLGDFHGKIMSFCNLQDGCSVTLARLSSAAVSTGFGSSAAFQTLLRFVLSALLRGVCTSTESTWSHEAESEQRARAIDNQPFFLSCVLCLELNSL